MAYGLGFGFNSQKQSGSSTSNSTTNSTGSYAKKSTTTAPDWLNELSTGLVGGTQGLAARNPMDYVAGTNDWIGRAGSQGSTLGDQSAPGFMQANDVFSGIATGPGSAAQTGKYASVLDGLGNYMSPYTQDVVNSTAADLDYDASRVRSMQDLSEGRSKSFGGSGAALTRAQTEGELYRGKNTILSGLRDRGFGVGAQLASQDADRRQGMTMANMGAVNNMTQFNDQQRLAGATGLSDNSATRDANTRANMDAALGFGTAARGMETEMRQAPLDLQAWQIANLPPWLQAYFGSDESGTEEANTVDTETTTQKGKVSGFKFGASGGKGA